MPTRRLGRTVRYYFSLASLQPVSQSRHLRRINNFGNISELTVHVLPPVSGALRSAARRTSVGLRDGADMGRASGIAA